MPDLPNSPKKGLWVDVHFLGWQLSYLPLADMCTGLSREMEGGWNGG